MRKLATAIAFLTLLCLMGCDKMMSSVHEEAAKDHQDSKVDQSAGQAKVGDKMAKDSGEDDSSSGRFKEAEDQSSVDRRSKAMNSIGLGSSKGSK